jgi:hypothetical protein
MMKKIIFAAAMCLPLCVFAQKNVELLAAAEETGSAMIYTLPKTALEVRVEVRRTVQKAGPYAAYAQQYFGFEKSEIVGSNRSVYEIAGIEIRRKGVPDPTRTFQVTAASDSKAGLICLTDNGIIESVNMAKAETEPKEYQKVEMPAGNVPVYFDQSDLVENYFLQTDANKKREVAASQIYQLRETQYNLLSANTQNEVHDPAALQLMLDELKRRENLLLELFKGKNVITTEYKTFEITPERAMKDRVLFYFSPLIGVTSAVEGITDSYFISLKLSKKNGQPTVKNSRKNGFFHCIPVSAEVAIYNSERSLYKESVPMAQFGSLVSMPVNYLDKNNAAITIDTTTGAIKSIK